TAARRHSVFLDIELWDGEGPGQTFSCAFLAAVWQLLRLGLLRNDGRPVLRPRLWDGGGFPQDWDDLPPLLQLNPAAPPFAAYRTCSLLPSRYLPVEHAVLVLLDQIEVDPGALQQVAERSAGERARLPEAITDRTPYVFYPGPWHGRPHGSGPGRPPRRGGTHPPAADRPGPAPRRGGGAAAAAARRAGPRLAAPEPPRRVAAPAHRRRLRPAPRRRQQ